MPATTPQYTGNMSQRPGSSLERITDYTGNMSQRSGSSLERITDYTGNMSQRPGSSLERITDYTGNMSQRPGSSLERITDYTGNMPQRPGSSLERITDYTGNMPQRPGSSLERITDSTGNMSQRPGSALERMDCTGTMSQRSGLSPSLERIMDFGEYIKSSSQERSVCDSCKSILNEKEQKILLLQTYIKFREEMLDNQKRIIKNTETMLEIRAEQIANMEKERNRHSSDKEDSDEDSTTDVRQTGDGLNEDRDSLEEKFIKMDDYYGVS